MKAKKTKKAVTAVKKGFFWHVHHMVLLEWCFSYSERATYIRRFKPVDEQKIRLRLFKRVKGRLPHEVVEAWQAYEKARQVYKKAERARCKASRAWGRVSRVHYISGQAYREALQPTYERAQLAYEKARQVYEEAGRVYEGVFADNMSAIEALHKKECKNCPWDGNTIFPVK